METLKIIGIFLLTNMVFYLVGSFISWNLDLMNWWLIKTTIGRVIFLVIEAFLVAASLELSDK
jgi:hypothetical protein